MFFYPLFNFSRVEYDHALVLNENSPSAIINALKNISEKTVLSPFQPTNENLVLEFVEKITKALPENVELCNLKLYETTTSYVEWKDMA